MVIDVHVHCRDWNWKHKETVAHALSVAEKAGLSAIFDMPNTDPLVLTKADVEKRLELVPKDAKVWYGVYVGVTTDLNQVRRAADLVGTIENVVGLKMFAGKSVGNLTVAREIDQISIYNTLAECGYLGVLTVHCEKESLLGPWDPKNPISHATTGRPPISEIASVEDQIKFAIDNDYKGVLNIAHASCPETVELVKKHKDVLKITCEATPHHLFLNQNYMDTPNGLRFKMNPPLRYVDDVSKLMKYLQEGYITMLGTDHAPHTLEEKIQKYMSGIPGLHIWPKFLQVLKNYISDEMLQKISHQNAIDTFKLKVKLPEREPTGEDLSKEYESIDAWASTSVF